jgi:hypothetical protein
LISDIKTTNQLLQKIGIIINDDLLPFIVIKNLPESYSFLAKHLELKDNLTLGEVEEALDQEVANGPSVSAHFGERKRREHGRSKPDYSAKRQRRDDDRDRSTCEFCKRAGHGKNDCRFNPDAKDSFKPYLAMHILENEPDSEVAKSLRAKGFKVPRSSFAGAAGRLVNTHALHEGDLVEFDDKYNENDQYIVAENLNQEMIDPIQTHRLSASVGQAFSASDLLRTEKALANHKKDEWLIDSGATDHMSGYRENFAN